MGFPVFVPRSAGARRFLRVVSVALACLSVITCAEDPIGPAISEGRLRVVPVFDASARLAPLAINQVRVVVEKPPIGEESPEVVVDDTIPFSLDQDQLTIRDIRVPMQEQTEDFRVRLQMLSSGVLLFEGIEDVTLVRGRSSSSSNIPMVYAGPGANVATIAITPRDTTLSSGATFTFGLDGFDNQGAPVAQFYANWSLTGGPAAGARINAAGQLTAPSVRDTFYVKAVSLPNSATDSVRIIIAPTTPPPPAQVIPSPISGGDAHTCEIRTTGTYCWGENTTGQLGDGTTTNRLVPTPVVTSQTFVAISGGVTHTCALTAQGQAYCWGDNRNGELGDGTTTDRLTPTAVTGGLLFAQISASQFATCAVTLTGEGRCWGANFSGQLGDGTTTDRSAPTLVSGGHSFTRISSGAEFDISSDHTCAIDGNGAAWCWGDNSQGQLGTGNQSNSQTPIAVTGGQTFSEISVGGRTSCALTTTGSGFCWGLNFGVGLTSPTPVAGGLTYTALDMGDTHVCAKAAAGWVCGGNGSDGQLGDGSGSDQQTPVAPAGGRTYSYVAAGGRHSCGITASGTFCWGNNGSGQLGAGDGELGFSNTPVGVMGAPGSVIISGGNNQTGPINTELAIPAAIQVRDVNGQPVMGAEVSFTVTSGGGDLNNGGGSSYTFLTDASGTLSVIWTLGGTVGSQGLSARVAAAGVTGNPVSFTATGTTGATNLRTWQGGTSTAFELAANWIPAIVPGPTDSVVIGNSTNQPQLNADQLVGAISIVAGGRLNVNGHGLVIARGLSTGGTGVLVMQTGTDAVTVLGNATFDGGSEAGLLTGGGIAIGGNFVQAATTSGASYQASGSHLTQFTGGTPSVTFATPGTGATNSRFADALWVTAGTLTLQSPVFVESDMVLSSTAAGTVTSSNNSRLTVGNLLTFAGLTLNGVPLTISSTTSTAVALSNIVFQAMPTNVAQLVVNHPGDASAFTFTNLQFATTPVAPNGFYLDVTDNDGATNGVLTINMSGAAPASGGAFVQTAGGAVVNWPFNPVSNWTGAVSADWSNPANWSTNAVPGAADDVTITNTTLQPTLTADATARNITVSTAGARLTIGGHQLTISGNLVTHTDGLLVMTNPLDRVIVLGDAAFQGGNETGQLSAGVLELHGNFTQQQQTTPLSFVASGTHRTVMLNPSVLQTVQFCCTANSSGFQNLDLSGSFGINIQFSGNGVFVFDTLVSRPAAGLTPWLYMLGSPLTARRFNIDRLLVDRGTLNLNEQGVAANQLFDNVTFQNYLPTQTQLAITALGGSPDRTLTFNNLAFMPLSAGNTGRYLTVTASAQTLVVNLPGASPAANGPTFTTAIGNATVNWPAASSTWTGAASTDWNTAANWSSAAVPGASANVVIPAGTANTPLLSTATSINSLLVASGAVLQLSGTLTVAGNVDVAGTVPGTGTITMTGTANLRGAVPNLIINNPVTLNGNTTLSGGTATISGATANLTLNGFGFLAGTLVTQTGGVVTMTNPADSMVVSLDATFSGGSTLGRLTAGVIELRGNLTQNATSSQNSFTATGTRVRATGAGSVAYTLNSSSATLSRFGGLLVNKSGGFLALGNLITVTDSMIVGPSSSVTVGGTLLPRLLRLGTGSSVAGGGVVRMIADSLFVGSGASLAVTTIDFNGTTPQLIPAISYQNLSLSGPASYTLTGTTTVTGGTSVTGTGATLVLGGRRLTTNLFTLTGTALVNMTQALDSLVVNGNANFSGGNESGQMTAGVLILNGGVTVGSATALVASGTHKTVFGGSAGQTIAITGGGPAGARFQDVEARNTSTGVNLATAGQVMQVNGLLSLTTSTSVLTGLGTVNANAVNTAAGSTLSVAVLTAPAAAFAVGGNYAVNQTNFTGGGTFPSLTYVNVSLAGPGQYSAGTQTFSGNLDLLTGYNVGNAVLTIGRTLRTTGAGFLTMTDAGAVVDADSAVFAGADETGQLTSGDLRIRRALVQTSTVSPSSFVAIGSHAVTLTGTAVDVSFQSPAQSTLANLVMTGANSFIGDLRVNGNVHLVGTSQMNANDFNVRGTLTTDAGTGSGINILTLGLNVAPNNGYIAANQYIFDQAAGTQIIPAGTANLPYSDNSAIIVVRSTAQIAGPITTNGLNVEAGGALSLNGQAMTVNGNFSTTGTGHLVMTNPLDSLRISGNATFNGGPEANLTDGAISIGGNFTQNGTQLQAAGNHRTIFTGTNAVLTSPAGEPVFNDLQVAGSLTLATPSTRMRRDLTMFANSHLASQTTEQLNGGRNVSLANGSTVTPSRIELSGTLTSAGVFAPGTAVFTGTGLIPASSPNVVYQRIQVASSATGYTAGGTVNAPNGMTLNGPFTVGANTVTVNDLLVFQPTGLLIMNNSAGVLDIATIASFDGGDETGLLTAGTILVRGSMTQSATNSPNSFRAIGTHSVLFNGTGGSQVAFETAGSQFQNLAISMPSGSTSVTGGTIVVAGNLSVNQGPFILNNHRVDVLGNFSINGASSTLRMLNPGDSLMVTGTALFAGASTDGLLTNGVLRLSGDFIQNATVSQLSFAPSGVHKTVFNSAIARSISMGSPGLGAAGSHFQVLDVTQATGGVSLDVNMAADSLISTSNLGRLVSDGQTLTFRRAQVSGLNARGVPLILDEQGVASAENLSGINFNNFVTGPTMLTVSGPGLTAGRPAVTTNNLIFQGRQNGGADGFYVALTSTNSQAFNLNMTTSNQNVLSGNGITNYSVTPNTGVATVSW